jgi:hypothetical protein
VVAVQFSPDGKRLLTQCGDGFTILWDVTQTPARAAAARQVQPAQTWFGLLLPDSRTVATGGADGTIRLWDSTRAVTRTKTVSVARKSEEAGRVEPETSGWQEVYRSFKDRADDSQGFELIGPEANQCVKFEQAGLRVTLPLGYPGKRFATGIAWATPIKGDFEITVGYEILQEPEAKVAGEGTGVFIGVDLNTPKPNRATLTRGVRPGSGKQFISWYALTRDDADKAHADNLRSLPANSRIGRLRLVRMGSMLSFLAAEGDKGEFRRIYRDSFRPDDVEQFRIGGYTGGPEAALDARVIDVRIRTKSMLDASVIPGHVRGKVSWLPAVGILAMATGSSFLGLWWIARRNRLVRKELAAH